MKTYDLCKQTNKLASELLKACGLYRAECVHSNVGFIRVSHDGAIVEIQHLSDGVFVIDPLFTDKSIAQCKHAIDSHATFYKNLTLALSKFNVTSSKAYEATK